MSSRFISPFYDIGSGIKPPSGAFLFFFEDDGVTPKDTFSDQLATPTPNANPVEADSNGVFGNIYIIGSYKVTLKDKDLSQIYGLAAVEEISTGDFDTNLINDLSQSYIFDTVALMASSIIVFPAGKSLRVLGSDILYKVTVGTSPDNSTSPDLTGFGYAARQEQDIISADEYASFGANVVTGATALVHVTGSTEILDAAITVLADTFYKITIDITTTDTGFVKVFFGNDTVPGNQVDAIYGDQPAGLYFSTDTILLDGTENNRIMTVNLYTLPLYTASSGYTNLHIDVDATWGGTISSVTIEEVNEKPAYNKITPSDGVGRDFYTGLKGSVVNRNDLALGDKSALGMYFFDGVSPTQSANTAIGSKALSANVRGDQNTAIGAFALQSNEGSDSVAVGYSSLKLCTKGQENTAVGYKSGTIITTGYQNTLMGFWAGAGIKTGWGNVHLGWRPAIADGDTTRNVHIGHRAGTYLLDGSSSVIIGASAGKAATNQATVSHSFITTVGAESNAFGDSTVTLGHQARAGTEVTPRDSTIAIGANSTASGALSLAVGRFSMASGTDSHADGYNAQATGDQSTSIGAQTTATDTRSTSVGHNAVCESEQGIAIGSLTESKGGIGVTAVGSRSGTGFAGAGNTFLGRLAGFQVAAFTNCTLLGQNTLVTATNQVQLGDSATTTYAYGAVQDRSDIRDKLDVKGLTDSHIDFFMEIEWKQYRMNHRERYIDVVEHKEIIEEPIFHELHPEMIIGYKDKEVVTYERVDVDNDGSRAGSRFHIGAIAQQVEAAMKKHGVDFAGLQHHSINGGQDVYTIGYQEFIGIQGLIIQRQQARLSSIESRLTAAGI